MIILMAASFYYCFRLISSPICLYTSPFKVFNGINGNVCRDVQSNSTLHIEA